MTAPIDHRLERLTFFSDAVIAIAITLLVIELHAPHLPRGDIGAGLAALAHLVPSFFGFFLSFAVIARFWVGHHSMLADMTRFDPVLLLPNFGLLLMIAFIPFATAFMSSNLGEVVPTAFYNATLLTAALFNARLVWVATDIGRGLSSHADETRTDLRTRSLSVLAAAVLALLLSFVVPIWSQAALGTIPLWRRLAARVAVVRA